MQITSRNKLIAQNIPGAGQLPPIASGLECVLAIDGRYAATLRFRDAPRAESLSFVQHLGPKHQFQRVMIVSGDRESEVRYLADQVGITEIYAQKSPEEKLAIVRKETAAAKTLLRSHGPVEVSSLRRSLPPTTRHRPLLAVDRSENRFG